MIMDSKSKVLYEIKEPTSFSNRFIKKSLFIVCFFIIIGYLSITSVSDGYLFEIFTFVGSTLLSIIFIWSYYRSEKIFIYKITYEEPNLKVFYLDKNHLKEIMLCSGQFETVLTNKSIASASSDFRLTINENNTGVSITQHETKSISEVELSRIDEILKMYNQSMT